VRCDSTAAAAAGVIEVKHVAVNSCRPSNDSWCHTGFLHGKHTGQQKEMGLELSGSQGSQVEWQVLLLWQQPQPSNT
jgi:hypothetical protein